MIPACLHYGVGVPPGSPLRRTGGGFKAIRWRRGSGRIESRSKPNRPGWSWEGLCDEMGNPPADVALAWLLHNPAVTATIVGPAPSQQLDDAVRALDITLDESVLARLDEIFPGPGGPAPQAYAW